MYIETTEDLCNQIADWIGVYGACKAKPKEGEECPSGCENKNPLCCRVGFMIEMQERMVKAVENDKSISALSLSNYSNGHVNRFKYNLTFWQKVKLIPLGFLWLFANPSKRKTWHEVKKGMEKHKHRFTKPITYRGFRFMECEHEGCKECEPID